MKWAKPIYLDWIWKSSILATCIICSILILETSRNIVEAARIWGVIMKGVCG